MNEDYERNLNASIDQNQRINALEKRIKELEKMISNCLNYDEINHTIDNKIDQLKLQLAIKELQE